MLVAILGWAFWSWIPFHGVQVPKGDRISDLIVVLDGGSVRWEQAERYRQKVLQEQPFQGRRQQPQLLLIRCPRTLPPPQSTPELLEGYDTVTQITALSGWLQRRQIPPPQRLWIATDPGHTARASLLARIALGGKGIQIQPDPPPTPSPIERSKLIRDALRVTLRRLSGSTGAWLVPQIVAGKRTACGL